MTGHGRNDESWAVPTRQGSSAAALAQAQALRAVLVWALPSSAFLPSRRPFPARQSGGSPCHFCSFPQSFVVGESSKSATWRIQADTHTLCRAHERKHLIMCPIDLHWFPVRTRFWFKNLMNTILLSSQTPYISRVIGVSRYNYNSPTKHKNLEQ